MRYYQLCTTGTSLLCSIYVFILHTGRPTKSKTCLTKLECLLLASVREKEKKDIFKKISTFTQNLPQHLGEHSISTQLLQAASSLS